MCRKCAAKRRNRRGNILLLCPKVRQGAAAHWKEPNTRIERGAAYHLLPTEILTVRSQPDDLGKQKRK